jgi:hypothetical protein
MILGAWSFGDINKNEKEFIKYVDDEALIYNNPPIITVHKFETKLK